VRSTDGGASWSAPAVLVPSVNATGAVPWDGALFLDAAGRARFVFAASPLGQVSAGDLFTTSSGDEGATWSAPSLVFPRSAWGRASDAINPPVRLRDGSLALPVYTVPGRAGDGGPVSFGLVAVGGDGAPWSPLGLAPSDLAGVSTFLEAAVARCAPPLDGQLLALLRTNVGALWAARSADAGASWTAAYETPFRNPDSKVALLQWEGPGAGGGAPADGDLVLALNPAAAWGPACNASHPYCARTPLALAVSRDCGGSWGPLYTVEAEGGGERAFHYPTVRQCADARGAPAVCMTYSVNTDGSEFGGIRFAVVPAASLA